MVTADLYHFDKGVRTPIITCSQYATRYGQESTVLRTMSAFRPDPKARNVWVIRVNCYDTSFNLSRTSMDVLVDSGPEGSLDWADLHLCNKQGQWIEDHTTAIRGTCPIGYENDHVYQLHAQGTPVPGCYMIIRMSVIQSEIETVRFHINVNTVGIGNPPIGLVLGDGRINSLGVVVSGGDPGVESDDPEDDFEFVGLGESQLLVPVCPP